MNVQSGSAYIALAAIEGALVAVHRSGARGSSAGPAAGAESLTSTVVVLAGGPVGTPAGGRAPITGRTRTARAAVGPVARAA